MYSCSRPGLQATKPLRRMTAFALAASLMLSAAGVLAWLADHTS